MSILHLVRHGQASFGADDYDNLSPKGIQQSIELGKALSKQQSIFDYVIVGPHRRHMQTFEGIKEGYASKNLPTPVMNNDFAENNALFDFKFNCYPNPSKNKLKVQYEMNTNGSLKLLNIEGKTLINQKTLSGSQKIEIDTHKLKKGIYFINLSSDSESLTKKIIKL